MRTVRIRDAVETDLARVSEIYTHESRFAYSTFETEQRPIEEWRRKVASADPFVVATEHDTVLGFAYASPFRDRPAYHRTRETSIYLDQTARGEGIGNQLYAALLQRMRAAQFHTALALVALPNHASDRLHRRHGFEKSGLIREVGDKHGRMIDVAIYQLILNMPAEP